MSWRAGKEEQGQQEAKIPANAGVQAAGRKLRWLCVQYGAGKVPRQGH